MITEEINLEQESQKYQFKDEIDHILDRSSAWIGSKSIEYIDYLLYQPSTNKIQSFKNVEHNAGLLKLVDEVITNSVDESRRPTALYKIDNISIDVNTSGRIKIRDNGGIAVINHKELKVLIPQMIFGMLRTSSNYDDTQERDVAGTNGLGAKLTNIYSKEFIVRTADGKNSVEIKWSNNMRDVEVGTIIPSKEHFTEVEFQIDLERFGIEELNMAFCRVLHKRAIDAAATNPQLTINYICNIADGRLTSDWHFPTYSEYVKMFLPEGYYNLMLSYANRKDEIIVCPAVDLDFGFVNGAICSQGTHFKKVHKQIADKILRECKEEDMDLITEKDIESHISVFIKTSITNPEYTSQTKEKLSSVIKSDVLKLSDSFLEKIVDSKIMELIRNFYNTKYAKEKAKELSKLNKAIKSTNTKKLIKSNTSGNNLELWLFEGDSAAGGFRLKRNPAYQSAYLLRGKVKNTMSLRRDQILENVELREIIAACKLQFEDGQRNVRNCPFDKIIFATDMDQDGSHICGLLLAFFGKHFPELIKAGKIYRAQSPLVVCTPPKGKEKKYYYTLDDFEMEEPNLKGYSFHYCKGLGSLKNEDYYQMLHDQKLLKFSLNSEDYKYLEIWFNKSTEQRKSILLEDNYDY